LVAGVPCKVIRPLSQKETEELEKSALHYKDYAKTSSDSLIKKK